MNVYINKLRYSQRRWKGISSLCLAMSTDADYGGKSMLINPTRKPLNFLKSRNRAAPARRLRLLRIWNARRCTGLE